MCCKKRKKILCGAYVLLALHPFQFYIWWHQHVINFCLLYILSFTFFHSSEDMSFNWSAGTSSFSILGIMTNCDLSESTLTLNSSPPRVIMSSLVQLWYPRRYLGISYKVAEGKTCCDDSAYWKQVDTIGKIKAVFGASWTLYLWEMKGEVCNLIFPWAHIEPEFPLIDHKVGDVGLIAWERRTEF